MLRVPTSLTRIFSDLHYGDRASALTSLNSITPLFDGADEIVLNGDTLDTRPSRHPAATIELREEVQRFFKVEGPPATWLTGNHDPDISNQHAVELAGRSVFVTHGDILFEELVPWGRDAAALRRRVAAEVAALPPESRSQLAQLFPAYRRAAASIPQRHQSERNRLKYAVSFAADTFWPPLRFLHVLRAWRETPARAAALLARHRLPATHFVMGHTHRLGVTSTPSGLVVINTGAFCPPCSGGVVDVTRDLLILRSVERRGREYRLGAALAEFELAGVVAPERLQP